MSKRTSNTQNEIESVDPQDSLIKSLESIKTLLKQGDSKISEARENIARADKIHSSYKDQPKQVITQETNTNKAVTAPKITVNPNSILTPKKSAGLTQDAMNIKTIQINNKKSKDSVADSKSKKEHITKTETNNLNDLYDHELIVPMLDEIIVPDDQHTGLFNMDSSIRLNHDTDVNSTAVELAQTELPELTDELLPDSQYNSISQSHSTHSINDANADIISFDLNSSNKKINKNVSDNDITAEMQDLSHFDNTKIEISSELKLNQTVATEKVIIKETTTEKSPFENQFQTADLANSKESLFLKSSLNNTPLKNIAKPNKHVDIDLTPAIASSSYTDNVLDNLTSEATDDDMIVDESFDQDLSKIDGINKLNLNSQKISALEKRVEKRVHNRLIEIIVQLDEDIKKIFTDEIKKCVEIEIKDLDKNQK